MLKAKNKNMETCKVLKNCNFEFEQRDLNGQFLLVARKKYLSHVFSLRM